MMKTFEELRKNVKFKPKLVQIDNAIFKLHYLFTFVVLLICTILVSSQQYIGEHIRCIADKGVDAKVIETFCFFTSTYTVVRHLNGTDSGTGDQVPHPGVGPMNEDEPIIRHAYYQWVPFVLFGQALLFYIPHLIWKKLENGRVKSMVAGFEYAALATHETPVKVAEMITVPSADDRMKKINLVTTAFFERLQCNRYWALTLILCETLNIVNLVLQVWAMNSFLGGQFMGLGELLVGADPDSDTHPLDIIFPKVTKCTFHKYGPSGSIQQHDAMCVMALNVINEKIYAFLWFWFIILFILTVLSLIYRLLSMVLYKRSVAFNRYTFRVCCPVPLDDKKMQIITDKCGYSNWVLLHYLAFSMDGFVFRELFNRLAEEIDDRKPHREDDSDSQDTQPLKYD